MFYCFSSGDGYYYHPDHLGSSNYITDYEGEEYEHLEFMPYGETWVEEGRDILDQLNYNFTGKELDTETGFYYFGARYLDPHTSRWLSPDPLGAALANPNKKGYKVLEGNNWYGYCSNNPVNYVDPTGLYDVIAEDRKAYFIIEEGDTLWSIVENQNPSASNAEILTRTNEIAILNNLDNPDSIKPGQKLLAPESVVPNITKDLTIRMWTNSEDAGIQNPFYFKDKVKSGGDWDLKSQDGTIYDTTPLQFLEYLFNNDIVRYDAPGNIHYGYVGSATWYGSEETLLGQAGYAQIEDNPDAGWTGDDPVDAYFIKMGIEQYRAENDN